MIDVMPKENNFVGYEYKSVTIHREMETIYTDGYESFGWIMDGRGVSIANPLMVTLQFKRDRKFRGKAEVTRLQRQFEAYAKEVLALERSKASMAAVIAYVVGIVGTACMAGAVFLFLGGSVPLMIVLAIPGLAGWILPYFIYNAIRKNKTEQVSPLIDKKYDEIYSICEKVSGLLHRA